VERSNQTALEDREESLSALVVRVAVDVFAAGVVCVREPLRHDADGTILCANGEGIKSQALDRLQAVRAKLDPFVKEHYVRHTSGSDNHSFRGGTSSMLRPYWLRLNYPLHFQQQRVSREARQGPLFRAISGLLDLSRWFWTIIAANLSAPGVEHHHGEGDR
jgi:hypothetical protein